MDLYSTLMDPFRNPFKEPFKEPYLLSPMDLQDEDILGLEGAMAMGLSKQGILKLCGLGFRGFRV